MERGLLLALAALAAIVHVTVGEESFCADPAMFDGAAQADYICFSLDFEACPSQCLGGAHDDDADGTIEYHCDCGRTGAAFDSTSCLALIPGDPAACARVRAHSVCVCHACGK